MIRAGHALILVVVGLLALGVVMVASAGLEVGRADAAAPMTLADVLAGRHTWFAATAIVLLILGSRFPVNALFLRRGLSSPMPWIILGSVVLLLAVHVPGIGREVNGARRWIDLGPIGFQPSELAKWGMIFVIAWHAARRAGSMHRLGTGFVVPMLLIGVICALIATEDLGTAVLIALVAIAMLVAGGARIPHAALSAPIAAAGFTAALLASPYRIDRLRAFLDPFRDPQGISYHLLQSMTTVSGGSLAGRGLGNGVQKFGYLPEDTTDFIFAVICEELGVAGAALVVFLYLVLLWCGFSIVKRDGHPFCRLVGLGILLTIGCQSLINLLVVTGLAPTKGIALPLVSAGGTGWCLTAFCIGLLVSMDRRQARAAEADPERTALPALAAPAT